MLVAIDRCAKEAVGTQSNFGLNHCAYRLILWRHVSAGHSQAITLATDCPFSVDEKLRKVAQTLAAHSFQDANDVSVVFSVKLNFLADKYVLPIKEKYL